MNISLVRYLQTIALRLPPMSTLLGIVLLLWAAFLLLDGFRRQAQFIATPAYASFYPVERNESIDYRFARPRATLFWPQPLPARSRLELRVFSPAPLPARTLTVSGPAGELASLTITTIPRTVSLLLPPGDAARRGYHITLESAAARVQGDPRELGLLYDEIALHAEAPALPWPRYLAFAALIVSVAALAFAVGHGSLAVGVGVLLLALLALSGSERFWWYGGACVLLLAVRWMWRVTDRRRGDKERESRGAEVPSRWADRFHRQVSRLLSPVFSLLSSVSSFSLASWSAALIAFAYIATMGRLVLLRHAYYGTNAFDLGLYDQTFYQISHFLPSYSTGAGLNMIGSHAALIIYPLSTLYWFLPDVRFLLLFQTAFIALSVLGLYLIGRDKGLPWLGVLAGALYLLHPAVQNLNLFDYHNDALAATLLIFALWAAERCSWRLMLLCCVLVMFCKENFALTTAMLGVYLLLCRHWRIGLGLLGLSVSWFFFATEVIAPSFSGNTESIHVGRFAKYGDTVPEMLLTAILQPQLLLGDMLTRETPGYVLGLLAPFASLALLHPVGIIALPTLAINLLSAASFQRTLTNQYNALIVAVFAVSFLLASVWLWQQLSALTRRPQLARLAIGAFTLVLLGGLVTQLPNVERRAELEQLMSFNATRRLYYDYLLSFVPPDANVATQSNMQPHLTHREQAFIFSNPFRISHLYDVEGMPFTPRIDYIAFDTRAYDGIGPRDKNRTLNELRTSGQYTELLRIDGIVLLRRSDA
jgi:uncharacterized membrane protein